MYQLNSRMTQLNISDMRKNFKQFNMVRMEDLVLMTQLRESNKTFQISEKSEFIPPINNNMNPPLNLRPTLSQMDSGEAIINRNPPQSILQVPIQQGSEQKQDNSSNLIQAANLRRRMFINGDELVNHSSNPAPSLDLPIQQIPAQGIPAQPILAQGIPAQSQQAPQIQSLGIPVQQIPAQQKQGEEIPAQQMQGEGVPAQQIQGQAQEQLKQQNINELQQIPLIQQNPPQKEPVNQTVQFQNQEEADQKNKNIFSFALSSPPAIEEQQKKDSLADTTTEETMLVKSADVKVRKILIWRKFLIFIDEKEIIFQQKNDLHYGRSKSISFYQCSEKTQLEDGWIKEGDMICILFKTESEKDQDSGNSDQFDYGLIWIQMNGGVLEEKDQKEEIMQQKNVRLNETKMQIWKNIDWSPITHVEYVEDMGLFILSTKSGNLHGFSNNMERIFFFEEPESQSITSFIYDGQRDRIIYSTSRGFLKSYDLEMEDVSPLKKFGDSVAKICFLSNKRRLLVLQNHKAVLLAFPDLKEISFFDIVSPSIYQEIYDHEEMHFAVLNRSQFAIYRIQKDIFTNVYLKEIVSRPSSFAVSPTLFCHKIVEIYYTNPLRVSNNQYSQDLCRIIVDNLT